MKFDDIVGVDIKDINDSGKILCNYLICNDKNELELQKSFINTKSICSKTELDKVIKQQEVLLNVIKELTSRYNEMKDTVVKLSEILNSLKENKTTTDLSQVEQRITNIENIIENNIVL